MKEEIKEANAPIITAIVLIGILCIFIFLIYDAANDDTFDREYFIIDDSIIEVIPVSDDAGKLDYLHVFFDNGDDYKIKTSSYELDLTVLELYRYPNWDEYGEYVYIDTVIKVPEPLSHR